MTDSFESFPVILGWELTLACNLRCRHCASSAGDPRPNELTLGEALDILYSMCEVSVVKLGEKGSIIKCDNTVYNIPPFKTEVINTNGAGDMYAAGVLYGLSNNIHIERAGKIGSYASSLVMAQTGARLNEMIDINSIK